MSGKFGALYRVVEELFEGLLSGGRTCSETCLVVGTDVGTDVGTILDYTGGIGMYRGLQGVDFVLVIVPLSLPKRVVLGLARYRPCSRNCSHRNCLPRPL